MKRAIDSEEGKARYGRRLATVESVFGNIQQNKRLDWLTLRGRKRVSTHVLNRGGRGVLSPLDVVR